MHDTVTYIHGAIPLAPLSPFWSPLLPFVSPSTYLAPSSCDRNRPPPSQVACKLTPFTPPFTQLSHPFPNSQNPNCPAPNNDDLGNIPALAIRNMNNGLFGGGLRFSLKHSAPEGASVTKQLLSTNC